MKNAILILMMTLLSGAAFGQAEVITDSLYSPSLGRTMPLSILVPSNYEELPQIPVLYLLHGHSVHHDAHLLYTDVEEHIEEAGILCVMPEGENSWWINSSLNPKDRYGDYLIEDVIGYIEEHYRVDPESRYIAGSSMGGYGALVTALQHPQHFRAVASIIGAVMYPRDKAALDLDPDYEFGVPTTDRAFGKKPGRHWRDHDPFLLYKRTEPEDLPYLFIFTGLQDKLTEIPVAQRELADSLNAYGARYEYHELPGGHGSQTIDPALEIFLHRINDFNTHP